MTQQSYPYTLITEDWEIDCDVIVDWYYEYSYLSEGYAFTSGDDMGMDIYDIRPHFAEEDTAEFRLGILDYIDDHMAEITEDFYKSFIKEHTDDFWEDEE